jgi:hypothetical protein
MRISHIIILIFIALVFWGCSRDKNYSVVIKDGVEIIKNTNIEASPELKLDLKVISEISLDKLVLPDSVSAIGQFNNSSLDHEGNIYISNFRSAIVYKIDKSGKYLTNFHKKGQGPGESIILDDIDVVDNNVYVVGEQGKVAVYDISGNFIKQLRLIEGKYDGLQMLNSGNDIVCATRSSKYIPEENINDISIGLFLLDKNNLENYTKILENKSFSDLNNYRYLMNEEQRRSCFFNNKIYIEDLSFDVYAVDAYDLNGKKVKRIEKQTRRIACSDKFKADVKEKDLKNSHVKLIADYMKQILWMNSDKYDNLWVKPAVEGLEFDHQTYDIFNSEGIFLKRINLPLPGNYRLIFDEDKLIGIDREGSILKVFDYEFI